MASGRHFPRDELVGIVWSGDDRSMTSADPAIFNPAEGGRSASSLHHGRLGRGVGGIGKLVTSLEGASLDSFILLT